LGEWRDFRVIKLCTMGERGDWGISENWSLSEKGELG